MAVKGVPQLISKLRKLDARIQQEVKEEIFDIGRQIEVQAESAAPISVKMTSEPTNGGYGTKVKTGVGKIAAYVEFGTGRFAAAYVPGLPEYWQKLALSFKTDTPGKMDKKPYFYPAYFRNIPILKKNLSDMLKRETKK